MVEWSRNTLWRQGALLTNEAVMAIGLAHPENSDDTVVIVATHACDLAQLPDKEPQVELVVGRRIQKLEGSSTHAKSSRTLHIKFEGKEPLLAEFVTTQKRSIPKDLLAGFGPETKYVLSPVNLATFQLWLASRYRRSAFPDEFERRLTESKLASKIAKAVKPYGNEITAVFFDVDEGQEKSHKVNDDVYVLDIILLYATAPDFNAAETAAIKAKNEIEHAFKKKLFNAKLGNWQDIELRYVDVISEEALTYYQSKVLKKWRLDYISLGADPQQPILAE